MTSNEWMDEIVGESGTGGDGEGCLSTAVAAVLLTVSLLVLGLVLLT